jgi:3-hydroxybutyrate dehydrogenase
LHADLDPGFVRTPPVEKQIPERARSSACLRSRVVRQVILKETVDGEFTTTQDVAECALFLADFPSSALTQPSR